MILSSTILWAETAEQTIQLMPDTVKDKKKSGINIQFYDQTMKSTDDFYQHVNGHWIKNTEIPAEKSRWGTFDILHEESLKQLHDIVAELSKQQLVDGSPEQKVASLYASFIDDNRIESLGIQPIQAEIANVDALKSKKDIAQLAAHFSRIGVTSPFDVGIEQDMKNSTEMIALISQRGLGLPDRDYYLKSDAKLKQVRSQYLVYIEKTLKLAGDLHAAQHAQAILQLETQIAKIQWSNVQNRDVLKLYNIYKIEDLAKLSAKIDWKTYLEQLGLADKIKTIQVIQPSYFQGLSPIVDNTPLEVWKAYFKFHLVSDFSPLLSKAFVDNNFDFYSHQLRDIKAQKSRWKRGVELVEDNLGESLGQIYVKKHFSDEKKQHMELLVQNLMKAYAQSIDQLDWMSPATKVQAQKKLASFTVKIGYPNKWRDYSALDIKADDLIGNVIRSYEFKHQYALNKLGKPVDREEWVMTPQTVNAYYNASLNEIVFPAAVLQPPFFDMNADDAVNYGAIGAVIGHEISHGFDDQGSQFDELGNMKNWWTVDDHRRFKEKTSALVAQYNTYEPIKGYHVNGELTLGENIADNSGLAVAYKAYQLSLNGQPAPVLDNLTGEQRFYIGWAQAWRAKITDARQVELIKSDPHSPNKVRSNATLVNQTPFYEAFGLKQGDEMYLPANKRITIW